ncbi:MAG: hypothetical protein B6D41_22130 [Chloroflexi bacterium UTCFX4]|jgi:hypothetical protein|nr:MAG: hypothetical protein B6D41_22130 [Chloroflexi bacterium UTCFX4]
MLTAFEMLIKALGTIQTLLSLEEAVKKRKPLQKYFLALYEALHDLDQALKSYPECRVINMGRKARLDCSKPLKEPDRRAFQKAAERCAQQVAAIKSVVELFDAELARSLSDLPKTTVLRHIGSKRGLPTIEETVVAWSFRESVSKLRASLGQFISQNYSLKDFS